MLSLIAVRQLTELERAAWRSMFNYFIFQIDGPQMEHWPDEVRGILGPVTPQRANEIWQHLYQYDARR